MQKTEIEFKPEIRKIKENLPSEEMRRWLFEKYYLKEVKKSVY